jgi:putative peptide zinc metalloprotease protein
LAATVLFLLVPWNRTVEAPVVLAASQEETLYLRAPARLVSLHVTDRQVVKREDLLFRAEAPELRTQIAKTRFELQSVEVQLARLLSSDKERSSGVVFTQQAERLREKLSSLAKLQRELEVRAPYDGIVVDLDPDVRAGVWIGSKKPLARIVAPVGLMARGVVDESDLSRLTVGAAANFISDAGVSAHVPMVLTSIAPANQTRLSEPALADIYGGAVAVTEERGELTPRQSQFEVVLVAPGQTPLSVTRGVVHLEAKATSPFVEAWRHVARVLVREQGF